MIVGFFGLGVVVVVAFVFGVIVVDGVAELVVVGIETTVTLTGGVCDLPSGITVWVWFWTGDLVILLETVELLLFTATVCSAIGGTLVLVEVDVDVILATEEGLSTVTETTALAVVELLEATTSAIGTS